MQNEFTKQRVARKSCGSYQGRNTLQLSATLPRNMKLALSTFSGTPLTRISCLLPPTSFQPDTFCLNSATTLSQALYVSSYAVLLPFCPVCNHHKNRHLQASFVQRFLTIGIVRLAAKLPSSSWIQSDARGGLFSKSPNPLRRSVGRRLPR